MEISRPVKDIKFVASGGTAPYTWALAGKGKLPAGLKPDPAQGTIQGTPEAAGSFPLLIDVKQANGSVGLARMTIEVKPAGDRK